MHIQQHPFNSHLNRRNSEAQASLFGRFSDTNVYVEPVPLKNVENSRQITADIRMFFYSVTDFCKVASNRNVILIQSLHAGDWRGVKHATDAICRSHMLHATCYM